MALPHLRRALRLSTIVSLLCIFAPCLTADQVAWPYLNPTGDTYHREQYVRIGCTTPGAVVHYTTDGNEPTESDPVPGTYVTVDRTMTIKAKAFLAGWVPSETVTGKYTLRPYIFSEPYNGTFDAPQHVTLDSSPSGAIIHYTTNGVEPTEDDPIYSEPIYVARTTTIKAKAYKPLWSPSDTSSNTIRIQAADPTFNPSGGYFDTIKEVTVTCTTPGAVIHYTLDGTNATEVHQIADGPIIVDSSLPVKAKAWKTGIDPSYTTTANFTIKVWTPSFSPVGGIYDSPQQVTISCATAGAIIRYTTNGQIPTEDDPVVTGPIAVDQSAALVARAYNPPVPQSDYWRQDYAIQAKTPTFSPSGGTYDSSRTVTISCSTVGAVVHYTTNGLDPTESDPMYGGPIAVDHDMTIKARAWKTGLPPSYVASASYILRAATPTFSTPGGTYYSAQTITVSCSSAGATIHYTTNGLDPTESDPVYTTPVIVDRGLTLKARAWKAGVPPSGVRTATYILMPFHPWFSPSGSTYSYPQYVTMTCSTTQAVIHYTTNGLEPTESDPIYSSPVLVDRTLTLKAKSFVPNWTPSSTMTEDYVIRVSTPSFSPPGGTYDEAKQVTISCSTDGAVIHYTTNDLDPTESDPVVTGPIAVDNTVTLKAKAFKTDMMSSSTASAVYTIRAATPIFAPSGGTTYYTPQSVTISCTTPETVIHYTMDGVDPTEDDPEVAGPVTVDHDLTLKAAAWKVGLPQSAIAVATYSFKVATPAFSPQGGSYDTSQQVTLTCATPGAAIHYTTNGLDPTESDPAYTEPMTVSQNTTLKARAWFRDWLPSDTRSQSYVIEVYVPSFNPPEGTYGTVQQVTISCLTPGAVIHYTTSGLDPTESDPVPIGPVTVDRSLTLKAGAWKSGMPRSDIRTGVYTLRPALPTFSPHGGTFTSTQQVSISCTTPGAVIRYTTNGADPTESSPIYGGPVTVDRNMTLKAKAYRTDWGASVMTTESYRIRLVVSFDPDEDVFHCAQRVTMSCTQPDAAIHYTTNGVDPTELDPLYTEPILVTTNLTLKAKAWKTGFDPSLVKSGVFSITATDPPVFSPSGGTYASPQTVAMSCLTTEATIHYTTNGADPTDSDPAYTGPLAVDVSQTIKAKAFRTGWITSDLSMADYSIIRLADLKGLADNAPVSVRRVLVTGVFSGFFYIEADDRSSGLRVGASVAGLVPGMRVDISGQMKTNTYGERCILLASVALSAPPDNTGTTVPLLLANERLGGAGWYYDPMTGMGQVGMKGSIHLNNIGLLVGVSGRVTWSAPGYLYFVLSDGSKVVDPSGYSGIRVYTPTGMMRPSVGQYVFVTGISACFKSGTDYYPLIRPRTQADIAIVP